MARQPKKHVGPYTIDNASATKFCSELYKHKHLRSTLFITMTWQIIFEIFSCKFIKGSNIFDWCWNIISQCPLNLETFPKHGIGPYRCKLVIFLGLWVLGIHSFRRNGPKHIGVTTLTFEVTWRHRPWPFKWPYTISYWQSFRNQPPSLTVSRYMRPNISASRPCPFYGYVTSSGTWPLDTPGAIAYRPMW